MTEIIEVPLDPQIEKDRKEWEATRVERERAAVEEARKAAYQQTADPLFFQWQAGEATEQEWLDARTAVAEAHPYPEGE